jgi:hypothetical protein
MKPLYTIQSCRRHFASRTPICASLASIGVAVVLGAVASAASLPVPSFATAKSYALGKGSGRIVLADLNGDGKLDIASPHTNASTVAVLLNRGDGRFVTRKTYDTGQPWELKVADLNGDAKPDLVTANTSSVSVLLNRGDGTFEARRDYPTGRLWSLAIRDLNNDGRPDLVTSGPTSGANSVSVFLNAGDGSLRPRSDYAIPRNPTPVSIVDLNGDGYPDLVTASGEDTVSLFLNRGDGTYETRRDFAVAAGTSLDITDLSGDNKPDIVTAGGSGRTSWVSVLLNDGNGNFGTRRDFETGAASSEPLDGVAIRDLNGDSKPDLLAYASEFALPSEVVSVFLNHGDGSFGAKRNYSMTGGYLPTNLLGLVDLNGDGRPDLVGHSWYASATEGFGFVVRLNRGDGSFAARRLYRTGATEATLADLNGDGKPDLALTTNRETAPVAAGVFFNRGDGRFRPRLDYPTRVSEGIDIADVNGDGKPDVVASHDRADLPDTPFVSVLLNRPGLCNVQYVGLVRLAVARQRLAQAGCRVGRVRYVHEKYWKGFVISQKPKFGVVRPRGARVNLVVNLGRH